MSIESGLIEYEISRRRPTDNLEFAGRASVKKIN